MQLGHIQGAGIGDRQCPHLRQRQAGIVQGRADRVGRFEIRRAQVAVRHQGIQTVGDLVSKTEAELLNIPNFGKKSIDEVAATDLNRQLPATVPDLGQPKVQVLDRRLRAIRPDLEVRVSGHTDSTGPRDFNMRLSQERAESVMRYLAGRGVAADRMVALGYGPDRPVADNRTAAGRAMNRRVELERIN